MDARDDTASDIGIEVGGVPARLIRKAQRLGARTLRLRRHGDHYHAVAEIQRGRVVVGEVGPRGDDPAGAVELWIDAHKAALRKRHRR